MGAVFGEVAVLIRCERAHSVRASAEGAARLAVIDRELFRSINEHYATELRKQLDALLSRVPFVVKLRPSDRSRITDIMDIVHFEPGDVIIHANQQAPSMFVLYEGKATVRSLSETGQSRDVRVLEAGDYCGEHTLLQDKGEGTDGSARARVVSAPSVLSKRRLDKAGGLD